MKRKITSVQLKAFMLLMIFVINMAAVCSCGFAQTASHHKMMMKDCCCCKKSAKKDCKDNHTISFNQMDKILANAVAMQVSIVHSFLISRFISLPKNNFSSVQIVYSQQVSVVDTSPPDLNILHHSFLI